MNALRERYKRFLFVFFGLNAKYRPKDSVWKTQYFAIAQATFFLAALSGVLISTALAFLTDVAREDTREIGIVLLVGIYASNLSLFRWWVGADEMQRMVSEATPENLEAAKKWAVILLVFTVPTIMFSIILISWLVRG